MDHNLDTSNFMYLAGPNIQTETENSCDTDNNITCPTLRAIHYATSIGASLAFLIAILSSIISLIIWGQLLKDGGKSANGVGYKRPTTMTPQIFYTIECMNIVVCIILYLRRVLPAIIISILLTPLDGCAIADFIKAMPYNWQQVLSLLWWVSYPPEQALIIAHQWIHLLLSYERYIFLCQPFKAWSKCSKKKMQTILWVIIVASFLCASPYWSEYHIYLGSHASANSSCTEVSRSRTRIHPCYIFFYRFLFHITFKYAIPWIIIIYHTVNICQVLKNMNRVKQENVGTTVPEPHKRQPTVVRPMDEPKRSSVFSINPLASDIRLSISQSPHTLRKAVNKDTHLDRTSCDSLTQLDKVNDNKNQMNTTYLCIAILSAFLICQLPRGIMLALSGFDNGPLFPQFKNCLENIDHHYKLDVSNGKIKYRFMQVPRKIPLSPWVWYIILPFKTRKLEY